MSVNLLRLGKHLTVAALMAVLYSQTWAAGNSTFTSVRVYERAVDGADALYPEMFAAEAVTINVSGHLDFEDHGDPSESYRFAGVWLSDFATDPDLAGGGSVQCRYKPNATSLADNSTHQAKMIEIVHGSGQQVLVATDPDDDEINFVVTGEFDVFLPFTFVADTEYLFTVDLKPGPSGYARLYVNGTLLHAVSGTNFVLGTGTAITGIRFGYFGLLGELWDIEISSVDTAIHAYVFGRGASADDKATVVSDLTVLMNLDEQGRTLDAPGTLHVSGNLIVTGSTTLSGTSADISTRLDALGT